MENIRFSFIVPVFNRPQEIEELLDSLIDQDYSGDFEVVIVEDGSTDKSFAVVKKFRGQLNLNYISKKNTGPGDSRNRGMKAAKGNYFIILDSDCILPKGYLSAVDQELKKEFVHFFGGPDRAHESFSNLQKSIDFSMTSFLTTGGIRGSKKKVAKYQPRSFNMGISKEAFEASDGFGQIHPGEDPDLTFRLWKLDYRSRFFPDAFVYHKRRISWSKFRTQIYKFGMARGILNKWHPKTKSLVYWFPSLFYTAFLNALFFSFLGFYIPILLFALYFLLIFILAFVKHQSIKVAWGSIYAVWIQFSAYSTGFLRSTFGLLFAGNKKAEQLFPEMFFLPKK